MYLFVLGMPGEFADWCDAVAAELATRVWGPTPVIRADTLEEIACGVLETGASHAVVSSRQPGGLLREAVGEHGGRFIVALDDPALALADLVLGASHDLAAATQAIAAGCGALIGYQPPPGALVLRRDSDWPQAASTISAIARHLQIAVDAAEVAELAERWRVDTDRQRHDEAAAWWNGLSRDERTMISGAVLPFMQPLVSQSLSITWTHGLFFLGDQPRVHVNGPVDITGRAHCVLCGPYILLPTGAWSLSLTMRCSRAAVEHEFLVEIVGDGPLASGTVRPQPEGTATLRLDFTLGDMAEHPIDLRVSTRRAAFDGAVSGVTATLSQAPPTPVEAEAAELVSFDE